MREASCCVIIINLVTLVCCQKSIGDICTIPNTGALGQCEIIKNCMPAIDDLGRGIAPHICGYQDILPTVCCVGATNVNPAPSTTKDASTTAPVPSPIIIKQPAIFGVGDKSRAKCKEYVKHVYQYVTLGGPPTADCVIVQVPLIVGGERAKAKEFPHMALIGFEGRNNEKLWQCGGSLISEQFVLTAAHCLYSRDYGKAKYIRLGELVLNTNADDAEPQDFNINQTFMHPEYQLPSRYNDIALLKIDGKAKLNPYVRPACLDTSAVLLTRKPVASGWGQVNLTAPTSEALQKVTLEYFTNTECNKSYRGDIGMKLEKGIIEETQICAGSRDESKDTCQGDSGGPLQIASAEEFCMYQIVGITSFGKGCGVIGFPAVYTRVSSYIQWIEDIVWP